VIREHFVAGTDYPLDDFVSACRRALTAASERVRVRYGTPCSLALGQLVQIEARAKRFAGSPEARILLESFEA
jgi:uncharacterized repeat protein (TIGR04042 family)